MVYQFNFLLHVQSLYNYVSSQIQGNDRNIHTAREKVKRILLMIINPNIITEQMWTPNVNMSNGKVLTGFPSCSVF
jgi:hypothetical protein